MSQQNDGIVKWTLRINSDLARRFAVIAEREHRSIEGQLRYMVEQVLEDEDKA